MSTTAKAHQGLAFLTLALGVVAFFLAGLGTFGDTRDFDPHLGVGRAMILLALVLVVLAAVGRREALAQSAVLLGLMVLQSLLAVLGSETASIFGALHPVNGLIVLFVAHQAARGLPLAMRGGPRSRAVA